MNKLYKYIPIGYAFLTPLAVAAQVTTPPSPGAPQEQLVTARIDVVERTLNTIIGLLFVLATLVFLWGVIKFVTAAGDEKKRSEGKSIMTWGIVGLAIMAAVWGIANLLINYFGVSGGIIPTELPR